jgi:hypothetical protein
MGFSHRGRPDVTTTETANPAEITAWLVQFPSGGCVLVDAATEDEATRIACNEKGWNGFPPEGVATQVTVPASSPAMVPGEPSS